VHFAEYLKAAFLERWNLLAFLAGAALGLISGHADVVLPLVAAGELSYIGLLATHPKFQKYVDARQAKAARAQVTEASQQTLDRIMRALPRKSLERFEALRTQCWELRQIAGQLRHPIVEGAEQPLEESQMAGLDRLLWIYLRLLYTHFALGRFLDRANERLIRQDIEALEKRIQDLPADQESGQAQRIRKTLEENLETCRARLANFTKARDNFQLVELQIDQLENKIRTLSEMAVNRQEQEFISNEVDHVATSMMETERTMNELQFATGLAAINEETPELLRTKATQTEQ